jgi:hypothetical protein
VPVLVLMPWRGARRPGEYPTLGRLVAQWIEAMCVIPDGIHQSEPYRLTDEMLVFLKRFYRLHPDAELDDARPSRAFRYRGALLMRPQKWGKSPFAGAIDLCEALGPVRFDGWDADGEPVGRPHPTPWVQIVSTSEDQTDNTWLALLGMAQLGPIADLPGIDIGQLDINLPNGGKIEPRTSSGRARLGARITHGHFDESHIMIPSNGGVLLAENMKRNIAGMGGRWMETTNAYDPSESSVAQRTHESGAEDVLVDYNGDRDSTGTELRRPDLEDTEECMGYLRHVYADSSWVDLERVLKDARDPGVCAAAATALRFFFNRIEIGVTDAVDAPRWDAAAREGELEKGTAIALGFDGSRSRDLTALVASRISDGRWFPLGIWDPAEWKGLVPRPEIDQVVRAAFEAYDVKFLYGDPYRWQEYFAIWASLFPERVVEFPTNVERRMDDAITRFLEAFKTTFTHNGNPILTLHAKSAALTKGKRRQPRPDESPTSEPFFLKVVPKRQGMFIDSFVAGILAEVARGQAIEQGALTPPPVPLVAWGR